MSLRAYTSVSEARASIGRYLTCYNGRKPYRSLSWQTPEVYFNPPKPIQVTAWQRPLPSE